MTLHMYSDGVSTVIAESVADAVAVWEESCGETRDDFWYDAFEEVKPGEPVSVVGDDGKTPTTKTAAEWIEAEGRGFLASSEY